MKIHLIGIGGTSMRGLAQYLVRAGHEVSGCDSLPVTIDGLPITHGHAPDHIQSDFDRVIYSSAVTPSAPAWAELVAARQFGIETVRRAQAIGEITRQRQTIAIAGAHGKSTTTGLIGHILIELGWDPLLMLGAPLPELGGQSDEWGEGSAFRWGEGPLVLEADEFDRSFLEFSPDIAVITNVEAEHLDYFTGGLEEITETFVAFLAGLKPAGRVVYDCDDVQTQTVIDRLRGQHPQATALAYGQAEAADFQLVVGSLGPGISTGQIRERDGATTQLKLLIPGQHNQANATAAFAVCRILGLPPATIAAAIASFRGVGRRFDLLAERAGAKLIFDYGHHPTEVRATIAAARHWYPNQSIRVIFQPHQYARTKLLFEDFVTALGAADEVVITDIYGVAGREDQRDVSAADLSAAIAHQTKTPARYVSSSQLAAWLARHPQPGVTLLMGAGRDIRLLAHQFDQRHD